MTRRFSPADLGSVFLRLALAGIFLTHGSIKVFDHEWGTNWSSYDVQILTPALQATVAWGELVCGAALLVGLLTRLAALGIIAIMLGAIYMVTWQFDFTIAPNSPSFQGSTVGYEYNYALMAIAVALVIQGAGALSLDRLLFHRREPTGTPSRTTAGGPVAIST